MNITRFIKVTNDQYINLNNAKEIDVEWINPDQGRIIVWYGFGDNTETFKTEVLTKIDIQIFLERLNDNYT